MKRTFLVLAAIFSAAICFAQDDGRYAGYGAVVELDSTHVTVEESGAGTFNICRRVRFLTDTGALKSRALTYGYDPLTAFARFKSVTVTTADGRTFTADTDKACDYEAPASMIYWGAREIMLEIGRMHAGDILEYEIEKKGFTYALLDGGKSFNYMQDNRPTGEDASKFIPPMKGEFYDIVPFWVSDPTERKVYEVSLPSTMKEAASRMYNGNCTESTRTTETGEVRTFTMTDIMPLKAEQRQVDWYDCGPLLLLSSTEKWEEKSQWFNGVNEAYGSFDAYAPAQKKVDEIIAGKKTDLEKITALTHWVADNIRYSGISMGKGEGFTLHNCKIDYDDRCGVCKDIAGTLISFLRMAGFEAYPAMTMAGSKIMREVPVDHFNHCVVVCKLSDGTYMPLDPTWVPFTRELWSSAEQQQNYLPGVPEGSTLCETPLSPAEKHYLKINAKSSLSAEGTLTGTVTVEAEGQTDRALRRLFTTGWQSQWKAEMERQILAVSPRAALTSVDWGDNPKDYQAGPMKIVFKFTIPQYAVLGVGNELMFKPLTLNNFCSSLKTYLRFDTSIDKREYGFKDNCSKEVVINETVKLPRGYKMADNAKHVQYDSKAASFDGQSGVKGRNYSLTQTLRLNKRVYEASDWEGFRNAVKGSESYNEYVTIKK